MLKFTGQLELPATSIMESIASQAFLGTRSDFEFYPWSISKFRDIPIYGEIIKDPSPFVNYCRSAEFDFDKCNMRVVEDANGNYKDAPTDSLYDDDGEKAATLEQLENTDILKTYLGQVAYNYISSVHSGRIRGKEFESNQVQRGMTDLETGAVIYDADIREEDRSFSPEVIASEINKMRCMVRKLVELSYNDGVFYIDLLKYKCHIDKMRSSPTEPIGVQKKELYSNIRVMGKKGWQVFDKYDPPDPDIKTKYWNMQTYLSSRGEAHNLNTDATAIIGTLRILISKYDLDIIHEDTTKFYRENLPSAVALSLPNNKEYDEVIEAYKSMPLGKSTAPVAAVSNFDLCQSLKDCIGYWSIVKKGQENVVFQDIDGIDVATAHKFLQYALKDYGGVPKIDMFSFSGGILCVMGYPYIITLDHLGYDDVLRENNVYSKPSNLKFFITLNGYIVPFITGNLPSTLFVGDIKAMIAEYESGYINTIAGLKNAWCTLRDIS